MKISRSENRAKQVVTFVNKLKERNPSKVINKNELLGELKVAKCPYPKTIIKALIEENILAIEGENAIFINNSPVHFSVVKKYLDEASRKNVESTKGPNVSRRNEKLLKAIAFIKNSGGKVYMPSTEFKEM